MNLRADYILTGTFKAILPRCRRRERLCALTFQLINPNNTDIVWEGFHEIKKQGKDDVTYR